MRSPHTLPELIDRFPDDETSWEYLKRVRWSKLCLNGMRNGVSAATGLPGRECDANDAIRSFSIKLGSEAVRVGQALGYQLVSLGKMAPERLALAGEGHADALAEIEQLLIARQSANPRAAIPNTERPRSRRNAPTNPAKAAGWARR